MIPLTAALLVVGALDMRAPEPVPDVRGKASWYGAAFQGKTMANGLPFDMEKMTCASWHFPLGTRLRVCSVNLDSMLDAEVIVTVTDRGPSQEQRDQGRVIDLSKAAFRVLAPLHQGLVYVRIYQLRP